MNTKLLVIVGLGIGAYALAKRASATVNPAPGNWFDPRDYLPVINASPTPQTYNSSLWTAGTDPWFTEPAYEPAIIIDPWTLEPGYHAAIITPEAEYTESTTPPDEYAFHPIQHNPSRAREFMDNLKAFLTMIRTVETDNPNGYNLLVGGGTISDFSNHPANLGWPGIRRTDGRKTTAAGAYQITITTWEELKHRGIPLPDFTPASQDVAAVAIMQLPWRQGAYGDVLAGRFDMAIRKLTNEWEAFDRILKNNYHYSLPQIKTLYTASGGKIEGETVA